MGLRCRSVCAAAMAKEVVLLWRSQSPPTSMTGTLGSTTNCSLQKFWRARVGDFRFSKRPTLRGRKESRNASGLSPLCPYHSAGIFRDKLAPSSALIYPSVLRFFPS